MNPFLHPYVILVIATYAAFAGALAFVSVWSQRK
jgi:hypothetical protein